MAKNKVAPEVTLKKKKQLKRKSALDPFVERLYEGVVVFSKSWQEDMWLYFKNEHIIISMFFAHPDHPFTRSNRSMVSFISIMVAYGLNCSFSSTDSATAALILSMTVGIVVQSMFDASLKFAATCPCVQKGCLAGYSCIRSCCLALGECFMGLCCCMGLVVLLIGVILLVALRSEEFGNASINFGGSKAFAFFCSTVVFCAFDFITKRRKQMRPFLIDPVGRDQSKAKDWLQGGYTTQEKLDKALTKWAAEKKIYFRGWGSPIAWCCCLCCVTIGGGPPDCEVWEMYFLKTGCGDDIEQAAVCGDDKEQAAVKATCGGVNLDELLTFENLPDHCPRYYVEVKFCCCVHFATYNKGTIPEEYTFKDIQAMKGTLIEVKAKEDGLIGEKAEPPAAQEIERSTITEEQSLQPPSVEDAPTTAPDADTPDAQG